MKAYFFAAALSVATLLSAQNGPAITDHLQEWGELTFNHQLYGHYYITTHPGEGKNEYIYTLWLLNTDLQPVGSKVFPTTNRTVVESVAYNGTHLGVVVKEMKGDGSTRLEIMDQTAAVVATHPLPNKQFNSECKLYPTGNGFVVLNRFRTGAGNHPYNFTLDLVVTEGGEGKSWSRRFGKGGQSLLDIRSEVLAVENDVILLRTFQSANKLFKEKGQSVFYAINLADGTDRIERITPLEDAGEALVIASAARTNDGFLAIEMRSDQREKDVVSHGEMNVIQYDAAGAQKQTFRIDLYGVVNSSLEKLGKPVLDPQTMFVRRIPVITERGSFSFILEPVRKAGKELVYTDDYAVAFSATGELIDFAVVAREELTVASEAVFMATGPYLNAGAAKYLKMATQLKHHGGPLNHALSAKNGERNYHFLIDRTFTQEQVTYRGLRAVIFDGNKLSQEFVTTKETFALQLQVARDGYVVVLEPKFGEGRILPRLEKLTL